MKFSRIFQSWTPCRRRTPTCTVLWTQLRKHVHHNSKTPEENNSVISHVPKASQTELEQALDSASQTATLLSNIPVTYRQAKLLDFYGLVKDHKKEFIHSIVSEGGKTIIEAAVEFEIALKTIHHYFSTPLPLGNSLVELRTGMDAFSSMESLGVTASITPFNYPLLIPVASIVPALAAGNTVVAKPSEKCPYGTLLLAKLVKEAGFPDGSLNVIYGRHATDYLCDHPSVKAVTFTGSTKMGQHVYSTAGQNLKRVQCFGGAKNHTIVMPDASKSNCFQKLMDGAFGEGGQRCLSSSVVIFVGPSKEWIADFVDEAKKQTKIMASSRNERKITALTSEDAMMTISQIIASADEQGADILLDGRGIVVEGYEKGNFIGPTILSNVKTGMHCYQEEIFGPVVCFFALDTLDEAIALINSNQYGNAAVIHTTSGTAAKKFSSQVDVGQVGVNVGITMPYPVFPYTGTKQSFYGCLYTFAKDAIYFHSKVKTHVQNWKDDSKII